MEIDYNSYARVASTRQGMSALGANTELARTDAALADAARDGDERAFAELYRRYGGRIYAYVLGRVRDHSRAEDITQDVFISALRRIRDSDGAIAFKPWIYEIARNACIDEFRRVQRAKEVSIEQHDGDERLVSPTASPNTCFEQGQQLATLHAAFRGLSERQHTVMVLRELEGLSYAEIARRTGMTLPMVESTLLRARRRLGQEYEDIASGRRCAQVHEVIDAGGLSALGALGLRERRRFARHIAHCEPCARYAQMAGIAQEERVPLAKRLAGLLPAPFARWPFDNSRGGAGTRVVRSVRRAAHLAPSGAPAGVGPGAAAAVAAIAIAGGGVAADLLSHSQAPGAAPQIQPAAAHTARSGPMGAGPARRSGVHRTGTSRATGKSASLSRAGRAATATGAKAHRASASSAGASPVAPASSAGGNPGASSHTPSSPLPARHTVPSVPPPSVPPLPPPPKLPSPPLPKPPPPPLPKLSPPPLPKLPPPPLPKPPSPRLPKLPHPRLPKSPSLPVQTPSSVPLARPPSSSLPKLPPPPLPKLALPAQPKLAPPPLPKLPPRALPKPPSPAPAPKLHRLVPQPRPHHLLHLTKQLLP